MMAAQKVSILTISSRIKEGEFDKQISKVFSSKEDARAELKSIKDGNNKDEEHLKNWRARTPIGQIDDLSIELLESNNGKIYLKPISEAGKHEEQMNNYTQKYVKDYRLVTILSFYGSFMLALSFAYSFVVIQPPPNMVGLFYMLQQDHYDFFVDMRWISFIVGIFSFIGGLYNFRCLNKSLMDIATA